MDSVNVGGFYDNLGGYCFRKSTISGTTYVYIVHQKTIKITDPYPNGATIHNVLINQPVEATAPFFEGTIPYVFSLTYLANLSANNNSIDAFKENHVLAVTHYTNLNNSFFNPTSADYVGVDSTDNNNLSVFQGYNAAMVVEAFEYNGINDWFIPNINQAISVWEFFNDAADAFWDSVDFEDDFYWTSSESSNDPTNKQQIIKFFSSNTGANSSQSAVGYSFAADMTKNGNKSTRGTVRAFAIRRIELPPPVSVIDADGSNLISGVEHIIEETGIDPLGNNFHEVILPAADGTNQIQHWYSSYIKFTDQPTNTALAIFGEIPNIVSVEYVDYAANGQPTTIYYKDSSITSTLTTLVDGAALKITRDKNAALHTFTITGGTILSASQSAPGFDFSIVNGSSLVGFPIDKTIKIDEIFTSKADSPEYLVEYNYGIIATSDISSNQFIWGRPGRLPLVNNYGSAESDTTIINNAFSRLDTAAKQALAHSVTVSGVAYSDWGLPTKFLADNFINDLAAIGGFSASSNYWTSSAESNNNAFIYNTTQGVQSQFRLNGAKIRPCREEVSTSNHALLSSNLGGKIIYKQERNSGSLITTITDDEGKFWTPGSNSNSLNEFTKGKAYYFETTGAFTFTELTNTENIQPVLDRGLPIGVLPQLNINEVFPNLPATMIVEMPGDILGQAIGAIETVEVHPSIGQLRISLVNQFAASTPAINTFLNGGGGTVGQGHLITHLTLMGELDTHSSNTDVYNNKKYKVEYNSKYLEILRTTVTYKLDFKNSNSVKLGGSAGAISLADFYPVVNNKTQKFFVTSPNTISNDFKFSIFANQEHKFKINAIQAESIKFNSNTTFKIRKLTRIS